MNPKFLLGIFCFLLLPTLAVASGEDMIYQANSPGGSGWDLYGDEEEDEEEIEVRRAREAAEQAKAEEDYLEKNKRKSDFFSLGVDVYDKSLSRTAKEEKKLKSHE